MIYYFSSSTGNTQRFISTLETSSERIRNDTIAMKPFLLFCPTYSTGDGKNAVPKQVIEFLKQNHSLMVGVVSSGNRSFGENFAISGNIISRICNKPLLHKYELAGTPSDTNIIRNLMEQLINDNKLLRS